MPLPTINTPSVAIGLQGTTGSTGATLTVVKSNAGGLYGWYLYNAAAAVTYCQLFDARPVDVILGTTVPTFSFGIPATSAANIMGAIPILFFTSITVAFTTTRGGLTGATVDYNFWFK